MRSVQRDAKVQIAGRLSYREELVKALTAPGATIEQAYKSTGAPKSAVLKVRRKLVASGVLKAGGSKW